VLNKIDLPGAEPDRVVKEIEEVGSKIVVCIWLWHLQFLVVLLGGTVLEAYFILFRFIFEMK